MSKYLDQAKVLRTPTPPANCAQSVIMPFSQDAGLSEDMAKKIASHFKLGMRCGGLCGAVSGALMVLGLYGIDEGSAVQDLYSRVRARHDGCLNCPDLLRQNKEAGNPQRQHCDQMVFECVQYVEDIIAKHQANT